MTKQMSISFHSTTNMNEHEKSLMSGTLEQRKEAFKEDEELMRETTKFISEVIETAATEASKRKIQSEVMKLTKLVVMKEGYIRGREQSSIKICYDYQPLIVNINFQPLL